MKKEIQITAEMGFKNPMTIPLSNASFGIPEREVNPDSPGVLWINNVFATNESDIPARFLHPFITTFGLAEVVEQRSKGGFHPRVRIFIPENLTKYANGVEAHTADQRIQLGTDVIQKLATNHFPSVDLFFEGDREITDEALDVLGEVAGLMARDPSLEKEVTLMRERGRRHGGTDGEDNSLLYAAQHSFGWSDMHHAAIFEQQAPFTVINTLLPSEKAYKKIREKVRETVINSGHDGLIIPGERFELFISMCDKPHYIMVSQGTQRLEPSLQNLLEAPHIGEIHAFMKAQEARSDVDKTVHDDLVRARKDFEATIQKMTGGDVTPEILELPFGDILERKAA